MGDKSNRFNLLKFYFEMKIIMSIQNSVERPGSRSGSRPDPDLVQEFYRILNKLNRIYFKPEQIVEQPLSRSGSRSGSRTGSAGYPDRDPDRSPPNCLTDTF